MSQPGESDKMTAFDHVKAIYNHSSERIIDICIVNVQEIPEQMKQNYKLGNSSEVLVDEHQFKENGIRLIKGELISIKDGKYVRHNYDELARIIFEECI